MIAGTRQVAGKFPGYLDPSSKLAFADIPNGLAAVSKVPELGLGAGLGLLAEACS